MTGAMLEASNVNKRFGGVIANSDISIAVRPGEIVGLIGPNGSGKTTLFNSIVGYHPVDSGTVARLGLLRTFQQTRVYGRMSGLENMRISVPHQRETVASMLSRFPREVDDKAEALLEFVGLYEKRHLYAGDLSFGQQKLLEFAMALMNGPKMLLLDEPTAGINPTLINGLLGITLLVIEHNMRVIMNLAERIYCLAHGELLAEGAPEALREDQRVIDAYLGAH
jgi:branched-chain amino acid transport system ATP-binding protein